MHTLSADKKTVVKILARKKNGGDDIKTVISRNACTN